MSNALFYSGKDVAALLMAAKHGAQASPDVRKYLRRSETPSVRELGTILLNEKEADKASDQGKDMARRLKVQAG